MLTEIRQGMPAYDEEIFGPLAAIIAVADAQAAIQAANDSEPCATCCPYGAPAQRLRLSALQSGSETIR